MPDKSAQSDIYNTTASASSQDEGNEGGAGYIDHSRNLVGLTRVLPIKFIWATSLMGSFCTVENPNLSTSS